MAFPVSLFILLGVTLVVSSIGFKKYVWFISLGLVFRLQPKGVAMLIIFHKSLTVATVILSALLIAYGLRLSGYLAIREAKNASYKKHMTTEIKNGKKIPFGVKIAIWVTCAALYLTQVLPVLYRFANKASDSVASYIGIGIIYVMFSGARRLEIRQNKNYGNNPEYQAIFKKFLF